MFAILFGPKGITGKKGTNTHTHKKKFWGFLFIFFFFCSCYCCPDRDSANSAHPFGNKEKKNWSKIKSARLTGYIVLFLFAAAHSSNPQDVVHIKKTVVCWCTTYLFSLCASTGLAFQSRLTLDSRPVNRPNDNWWIQRFDSIIRQP
jgi:hypothetical protein